MPHTKTNVTILNEVLSAQFHINLASQKVQCTCEQVGKNFICTLALVGLDNIKDESFVSAPAPTKKQAKDDACGQAVAYLKTTLPPPSPNKSQPLTFVGALQQAFPTVRVAYDSTTNSSGLFGCTCKLSFPHGEIRFTADCHHLTASAAKMQAARQALETLAKTSQEAHAQLMKIPAALRQPPDNSPSPRIQELSFVKGHKLNVDETSSVEFKGGPNPGTPMTYEALKHLFAPKWERKPVGAYVSAFLNGSAPARMLFGVHDDGTVHGVRLSSKQRDKIRLAVDHLITQCYPPITLPMQKIQLHFHLLVDGSDLYVVEVQVFPDGKVHFFNDAAYIRGEGSVTTMPAHELVRRIENDFITKNS